MFISQNNHRQSYIQGCGWITIENTAWENKRKYVWMLSGCHRWSMGRPEDTLCKTRQEIEEYFKHQTSSGLMQATYRMPTPYCSCSTEHLPTSPKIISPADTRSGMSCIPLETYRTTEARRHNTTCVVYPQNTGKCYQNLGIRIDDSLKAQGKLKLKATACYY